MDDVADLAAGTSDDCNGDAIPDECPLQRVDVVVVVDNSGSVGEEAARVCDVIGGLSVALQVEGLTDQTVTVMTIVGTFPCVAESIAEELGVDVPGNGACGPITGTDAEESWAPGIAIVAEHFDWRAGAYRVVIPVTDEAACRGNGAIPCDLEDSRALDNALAVANLHNIHVFPVTSAGAEPCVQNLLTVAAYDSGGVIVGLNDADPAGALADRIAGILARRDDDCNSNGVMDGCEIDGGESPDGNGNGRPDECDAADVRLYVDATVGGGAEDGSSWTNAYRDLRDAIADVQPNLLTDIWVAGGTYTPGTSVLDTFQLANGLAIYGGFSGDESELNERNVIASPTVLSGELAEGRAIVHIVTAENGVDPTAILDGFTVAGGRANWDHAAGFSGGGLWVKGGRPTIRNCTFAANTAAAAGGAAFVQGDALIEDCVFLDNGSTHLGFNGGGVAIEMAAPTIRRCSFLRNEGDQGGGLYVSGGHPTILECMFGTNGAYAGAGAYACNGMSGTFDRCVFLDNLADASGGGMRLSGASPIVSNSFFGSNGAIGIGEGGGGIAIAYGSAPALVNSVFSDNFADYGGGVDLWTNTAPTTIVNCSFSGNRARQLNGGGGLDNSLSPGTSVVNSIFWQNTAAGGSLNQIAQVVGESSVRISHSAVQGGGDGIAAASCPSGCYVSYNASNIDDDPVFLDPVGPDGRDGTLDDNFRFVDGSPCVDMGSDGAVAAIVADADGNPRMAGIHVDMGAYEHFSDCNTNAVLDTEELMDYDWNGTVDLRDFQAFQMCFDSAAPMCLQIFDRASECGIVDVIDYWVFEQQATGPMASTTTLIRDTLRPDGLADAVKSISLSPSTEVTTVDSGLELELRPLGGGDAVNKLTAHTSYEVHYAAEADRVNWYMLIALSDAAETGLDLAQPPVTGPWSGGETFYFEDTVAAYGNLVPSPNHAGLYRTDTVLDNTYLGDDTGHAPANGCMCIITTGGTGELTLELFMLQLPAADAFATTNMETFATFSVQASSQPER